MKKLLTLLLAVLLVLGAASCAAPEGSQGTPAPSEPGTQISAFNWNGGTSVQLSAEDSAVLLALLESDRWTAGITDCLVDVHLFLSAGNELEYHSDCGTFVDTQNNRSLSLTDEEQAEINTVLSRYITLGYASGPAMANNWGITLAAVDVTPTGLTIICTQSGGEITGELDTGSYYIVEQLTADNVWVPVDVIFEGEYGWTAEAWIIPMDSTLEWQVNWEWLYGSLPGGIYRIGKEFTDFRQGGDYDDMMIYAEFGIVENE